MSNLPIEYGDKVVSMISLCCNDSSDTFSPDFSFTPIALPIRGEYDDYGSVSNYYSQTCKYSFHKNFINACVEIIDNKINKKY